MLIDLIQRERTEILKRALEHLKLRYPERPDDELLDTLPGFLDELATALLADSGQPVPGARPATLGETRASQHGVTRRRQGFNFDRVVHDYGVMCDAIHTVSIRCQEVTALREMQILNRCVDEATALACEGFLRHEGAHADPAAAATAAEIHSALSSASLAFALIRKGRVAVDGATANVIERNLARVAERITALLAEVRGDMIVARRDRIRVRDLFATVRDEVPSERGAVIDSIFDPNLDFEGDAYLLALALGHLVRAAVACTPGNATVTLRAHASKATLTFEVEDRCADGSPTPELAL
ncbi:MAG TPA: hypothetical protein VK427_26245, partial [Kofleriaceae bacterium]|nr:hypothetical protein [Kofleriaceae bacterium]